LIIILSGIVPDWLVYWINLVSIGEGEEGEKEIVESSWEKQWRNGDCVVFKNRMTRTTREVGHPSTKNKRDPEPLQLKMCVVKKNILY
jgi:hypothetical protein